MGHFGMLGDGAMANTAHFGGCSSPESWHDPSGGTLAILCRLLPNLTPSRRGGVFSFAEIGLLCDGGNWRGINDARLELQEVAN